MTTTDCRRHAKRTAYSRKNLEEGKYHLNAASNGSADARTARKACKMAKVRYHPDRYKCGGDEIFKNVNEGCERWLQEM